MQRRLDKLNRRINQNRHQNRRQNRRRRYWWIKGTDGKKGKKGTDEVSKSASALWNLLA